MYEQILVARIHIGRHKICPTLVLQFSVLVATIILFQVDVCLSEQQDLPYKRYIEHLENQDKLTKELQEQVSTLLQLLLVPN